MTVEQYLQGLNAYPIPVTALERATTRRGLVLNEPIFDTRNEACRLAEADVWMWLAYAPNVAQGGQNYSFTDAQRADFKARAQAVYDEFGTEGDNATVTYGYKGSQL